jgi:EcsC protein family
MVKNLLTDGVLSRLVGSSIRAGFRRAYRQVQLNPEKYLRHVRRVYGLPIQNWQDIHRLDLDSLVLPAEKIIASSAQTAALEGMGLGIGGLATLLPDMSILAAITIRMLQKLSLIYGFEYSTEEEVAAFWIAAASAAGVDFARNFLEKQAIERVVPRIIDQIAVKAGAEVAEKWVGRLIPVVSVGVAGTLNYYFVRAWGLRAQRHFIERRQSQRGPAFSGRPRLEPSTQVTRSS